MADEYTPYEAVDINNDNDTALLPVPPGGASAFKFRKMLVIAIDAFQFVNRPLFDFKWEFEVSIYANTVDHRSNRPIFRSEVAWTARVIAFTDPLFGLSLVTWSPLPERITTTVVNGQQIDPADGWKHVDTPNPTQFSEQGFTVFSPDAIATLGSYKFFAEWFSPAWLQDIPDGAILDVNDSTNIGSIQDEATYFFAFKGTAPQGSIWLDISGGQRMALQEGNNIGIWHTYYGPKQKFRRGMIRGAKSPLIWKDSTNAMWVLALKDNHWRLWRDYLDGLDPQPLRYNISNLLPGQTLNDIGVQVAVWSDSYSNLSTWPRGQGAVSCAHLGKHIYYQSTPDNYRWGPVRLVMDKEGKAIEHEGKKCDILVYEIASGQDKIIITDKANLQLESTDDGAQWKKIEV